MRAVVFKEPHVVAVEDRPIPQIEEPTDVIVKVIYTALCGSELHVFRVSTNQSPAKAMRIDSDSGAPAKSDRVHHGTAVQPASSKK